MMGKFFLAGAVAFGIGCWGAGEAGADPIPLGGEFKFNSATTGDQQRPRIASSATGAFVAVWQGPETGGSIGIRAQRFTSSGVATGSEFAVNGTTTGDQTQPAIAMLANGEFVVAWQGPDASGSGIYARRFLANGTADTSELAVNSTTDGAQETPAIAFLEEGQFLVAWRSDAQDGSSGGIYARAFAYNGTAAWDELLVNKTTTGDQADPAVAAAEVPAAAYYVAWEGPDNTGKGVFFQQVSTGGSAVGSEYQVNDSRVGGDQENPALAASAYAVEKTVKVHGDEDPDPNRLVVVWQGPDDGNGGNRIWYQLYDMKGNAHGGNQVVDDDPTAPDQSDPDVTIGDTLTDGFATFTALWIETTASPLMGSSIAILAANRPRHAFFNGGGSLGSESGETPNSEILVSQGGALGLPAIAAESNGDFVCVWQAGGLDLSGDGVYGRRYLGEGAPVLELHKTVAGSVKPGEEVVYTLTLENYGPASLLDNDGDELVDQLPDTLRLLDVKASDGTASAHYRANAVTWSGGLGSGDTMVLTIWARIGLAAKGEIGNQATLYYDSDLDEDNESVLYSDDPAVAGEANPTAFVVDEKLFFDGFEKGSTDDWDLLSFQP